MEAFKMFLTFKIAIFETFLTSQEKDAKIVLKIAWKINLSYIKSFSNLTIFKTLQIAQ